ncbi:response regulator [Paenibacillus albidus]|uniref:response regulator n=1 Tax=Paenibacillus albidus TaxID=2041023 RepID=UPI001BE94755|nr:response regulator [Paenibacillus albidus]MBT2291240.1 response regulator [Paenibacillus albidus]
MWNLLVVEDESIVRMGLRYMVDWESQGIHWHAEAAGGEEALLVMAREDIHIVMTDIRMPGMDGLELAKQIKVQYPLVQIIFLSSYDTFTYVREAFKLGAIDYLHKPTMDEHEIVSTLQKVLAQLNVITPAVQPELTGEEKNALYLSLLDRYTFPSSPVIPEFEGDAYQKGYELVVFRKRDDAVLGDEDSTHLRFLSLQYLITEFVTKDWGGIVFHRSFREIIWIAPVRAEQADKSKYLETLRQKVLELLNVALIFAVSPICMDMTRLPEAYLGALLRFPVHEQSDNLIVRKAKEYIDQHLLEEVTLGKVGEAIHVSPGYLSRIFIKELGENFSDYIIRNKIEHAQKLLRRTNRKVYEIAADIGYTNAHYFSKLFKDRMGVTPLEYRNQ